MLPKLSVAPSSFLRVSSHGGARLAAVASLVGGVVVAVLAPRAIGLSASQPSGTSAVVAAASGDTQVVFGPRVFATPNGNTTTYVEPFAVAVQPERRYTLRLVNGATDGTKKATGGTLILNGRTLFGGPDFASGATLTRVVEVFAEDTIQVTVQGQGTPGAFVTVSIVGDPDPTFTVFAERFTRSGGGTVTDTRTFALPAGAAAPYYLHLVNGNRDGTSRMATGSLTLNGVLVATGGGHQPGGRGRRDPGDAPGAEHVPAGSARQPERLPGRALHRDGYHPAHDHDHESRARPDHAGHARHRGEERAGPDGHERGGERPGGEHDRECV